MTSKTHYPTVSIKTLNGAFEQPKMNHRRDFLRENKLSLRDLQKTTNQKFTQQKQELENRQYKHLQKFHKTQEQSIARRSASQSRNTEQNIIRQSRVMGRAIDGAGIADRGGGEKERPNYLANRRSYSQQRYKQEAIQNSFPCCCCKQESKPQPTNMQYHGDVPRSASSVSLISKAESCDKQIQTEDIHDEDFLYEALKKCSSSDIHHLEKQKSIDQLDTGTIPLNDNNPNCKLSRERVPHICQDQYDDNNSKPTEILQHTARSQHSCKINSHERALQNGISNGYQEDLDRHFQNFKVTDHIKNNHELQLSARSRQTLCSTSTKRSTHQLGSREDIRLPRYLEIEKRDKEAERLRELNKDVNCPADHYPLSEEERLKALNNAQQKMAALISELNHMPMTIETLRIRNRKAEIEKELTQIELDIRFYSKPKVYISSVEKVF